MGSWVRGGRGKVTGKLAAAPLFHFCVTPRRVLFFSRAICAASSLLAISALLPDTRVHTYTHIHTHAHTRPLMQLQPDVHNAQSSLAVGLIASRVSAVNKIQLPFRRQFGRLTFAAAALRNRARDVRSFVQLRRYASRRLFVLASFGMIRRVWD